MTLTAAWGHYFAAYRSPVLYLLWVIPLRVKEPSFEINDLLSSTSVVTDAWRYTPSLKSPARHHDKTFIQTQAQLQLCLHLYNWNPHFALRMIFLLSTSFLCVCYICTCILPYRWGSENWVASLFNTDLCLGYRRLNHPADTQFSNALPSRHYCYQGTVAVRQLLCRLGSKRTAIN